MEVPSLMAVVAHHDNFASWMVCWNYPNMLIDKADGSKFNPVLRAAVQALGRPWTRMAPTQNVFKETFADKTNDLSL